MWSYTFFKIIFLLSIIYNTYSSTCLHLSFGLNDKDKLTMTVLWAPDNTAHSKVKISVNILRPFPVFNKQDHQHSFTVTLSSMTGNVKPPAVSTDSSVCVLSVGLHDQLKVFFFFSFYSVPTNVSQWHLSQYYTKSNNNNKKKLNVWLCWTFLKACIFTVGWKHSALHESS